MSLIYSQLADIDRKRLQTALEAIGRAKKIEDLGDSYRKEARTLLLIAHTELEMAVCFLMNDFTSSGAAPLGSPADSSGPAGGSGCLPAPSESPATPKEKEAA